MAAQHLSSAEARVAAEHVARASYGRLIALLSASTGDVALAEDALASAFEQALVKWPGGGVPRNPEGWLLTVARNRQRDLWKSSFQRTSAPLDAAADSAYDAVSPLGAVDPDAIGDKRLELLFVCAHPAIEPGVRTPLMLQTVLGFDASRIAAAFAVPATAMAQRLVRAKQRIKNARIPFAVPDRHAMPERLPAVLEAIYGCYAIGFSDHGKDSGDLSGEAQYLAITLAALLDSEPEPWGLAALITLSLARTHASVHGFVPLDEQDTTLWDARLIVAGEQFLRRATSAGTPGRFQLEAAIQAVHCNRFRTAQTDWAALRTLYSALLVVAPSFGSRVALAAVMGRAESTAAGLAELEAMAATDKRTEASAVENFQPFHATRAELLDRAGRSAEAQAAFATAAALTGRPAVREYLLHRAADVRAEPDRFAP
ncbi:RNA polymerase sigma factor [Arthrobacter glacialis]|uniref:RNA polymerase sigma factor n=1 Tax=Arthrobacter glacialis TaxID=1664 RepID=UPI001FAF753A|nr:DUF6596 domain-containing protein [Arthrobacter glacialis]